MIMMDPGDVLFGYTDGMPEAICCKDSFYSFDRMLSMLNSAGTTWSEAIIDTEKSIADFTDNAEQFDDLTMLCIRYNGRSQL